jgi:tetratricopeptide (TPR) repeat protein
MRKWLPFLAMIALVGLRAGNVWAQFDHNARYMTLVRTTPNVEELTPAQLRAFSAQLEGRRAAIWLLAMAYRYEPGELADQIYALDLIAVRGLEAYLTPREVQAIVQMRSFQNEIFSSQGRFGDILVQADRILALAPDSAEGLVWKAAALGRLQRPEEAMAYFDRAQVLHPDSVLVLTQAAYYYFFWSPGRAWRDKAWFLTQQALSLDPEHEGALRIVAEYLMESGNCLESLPFAQRRAQLYPGHADSWRVLGNVYWCLGEREEARSSYRRAINISPDMGPALRDKLNEP